MMIAFKHKGHTIKYQFIHKIDILSTNHSLVLIICI